MIKELTTIEKIGFILLLLLLAISVYFGFTDVDTYNNKIAHEDGIIENLTVLFLFAISILSFYRVFKLTRYKNRLWFAMTLFFGVLFLFGAGEEISWGQRIFNVESGEFFKNNNAQSETNLHNLMIGDIKLNKLIFSKLLTFGLSIYLILTPILYNKYDRIKKLVDNFAIPLPRMQHILAFVIATIIIVIIPDEARRKWEVYELIFGILFLLIFLNPNNDFIYKK